MLVRQLGVHRSDAELRLLQAVFQLCLLLLRRHMAEAGFGLKETRLVTEGGSGKWVETVSSPGRLQCNVSATGRRLCPETHGSSHAAVSGCITPSYHTL